MKEREKNKPTVKVEHVNNATVNSIQQINIDEAMNRKEKRQKQKRNRSLPDIELTAKVLHELLKTKVDSGTSLTTEEQEYYDKCNSVFQD